MGKMPRLQGCRMCWELSGFLSLAGMWFIMGLNSGWRHGAAGLQDAQGTEWLALSSWHVVHYGFGLLYRS